MNNRFNLRTAKFKFLVLLLIQCTAAWAQSPDSWRLIIEPGFMRAPVSKPIAQAQRTILAAAYLSDSELKYFTTQQFSALKMDFEEFGRRALKNAREKNLKTEFVRDKNKVLESAYLHSEDPLMATVVLSPEFYRQFAKDFGPSFLVAIPNRFSVYVFPALASKYRDYAPRVLQEYVGSSYPVSLEVFELGESGLKAIGTYERGN